MAGFAHTLKQDYDKRVKIGDNYAFCYSKKKMAELYPEKDFSVSGEARRGTQESRDKFDAKQDKKLARLKEKGLVAEDVKTLKIGEFSIGNEKLSVYPKGFNNKFFEKTDGYACLSDGNFIAIHASRIPFLIMLSSIIAATLAVLAVVLILLLNPAPPEIVEPENPLPAVDPFVTPMEDDTSSKVVSESGGGSIRIKFAGPVHIYLSENRAAITYSNPNASNHDVAVELYLKDGDNNEYFLGRSGLVPAGNTLNQISVADRKVEIKEGDYTGRIYVHSYDPVTGEKAVVVTDINNVKIVVKP